MRLFDNCKRADTIPANAGEWRHPEPEFGSLVPEYNESQP